MKKMLIAFLITVFIIMVIPLLIVRIMGNTINNDVQGSEEVLQEKIEDGT